MYVKTKKELQVPSGTFIAVIPEGTLLILDDKSLQTNSQIPFMNYDSKGLVRKEDFDTYFEEIKPDI